VNNLYPADRRALDAAIASIAAETGRLPVALHEVKSQYHGIPPNLWTPGRWPRSDLFDGFVARQPTLDE
jgi:hypothetical protein